MANAPIRYLGFYDPLAEGKFLFEILAQLRNFGVGRLVTKNEWTRRWPDTRSYVKVLQAKPMMDRWLRHGWIIGDWVLRDQPLGVHKFARDLDRSDWRLIHRHHEHEFLIDAKNVKPLELKRPAVVPVPPLQQLLAKEYGDRNPTSIRTRVTLDEEHLVYEKQIKLDKDIRPKNIYDVDPQIYLQFYGKQLPYKMEKWDHVNRHPMAHEVTGEHTEKKFDYAKLRKNMKL